MTFHHHHHLCWDANLKLNQFPYFGFKFNYGNDAPLLSSILFIIRLHCDFLSTQTRFHINKKNQRMERERHQHFYYSDATLIDQVCVWNLEARQEKQVETLHKIFIKIKKRLSVSCCPSKKSDKRWTCSSWTTGTEIGFQNLYDSVFLLIFVSFNFPTVVIKHWNIRSA